MNASLCKFETEVMNALLSGPLGRELEAHVTGCAECSEIMLVAQVLERDADSMGEISIPNADLVWRRALSRSRAEAAVRAGRPIQGVIYASIAVMITAAFWWILASPAWLGWFRAPRYASSLHVVGGMWVAVSLVAGAVTILTALFGAVYILAVDRVLVAFPKT
jgi:hypothetical protein